MEQKYWMLFEQTLNQQGQMQMAVHDRIYTTSNVETLKAKLLANLNAERLKVIAEYQSHLDTLAEYAAVVEHDNGLIAQYAKLCELTKLAPPDEGIEYFYNMTLRIGIEEVLKQVLEGLIELNAKELTWEDERNPYQLIQCDIVDADKVAAPEEIGDIYTMFVRE